MSIYRIENVVLKARPRRRHDAIQSKATVFLNGIGNNPEIRAALATRGYTDEDHLEGWSHVMKLGAHRALTAKDDSPATALSSIVDWLDPTLKCTKAALQHLFPEQAVFVLEGLGATSGPEALVTATTLLDRLDALGDSPERKATRKADHEALKLLEKRNVDPKQRAQVRKLLELALAPASVSDGAAKSGDERTRELDALRGWYDDWSLTAHAVIQRRDLLIRIGLAKRIRRKPIDATVTVTAPPPVVAAPTHTPMQLPGAQLPA